MNILSRLERVLREVIEGAFRGAFPGRLHPLEITERLLEEVEGQKLIGRARVFVPNQFRVFLNPKDLRYLAPISHEALPEMEGSVSEYAKEHDYRLIGVPQVILQPDKGVRQGGLRVESAMVPESVEQTVPLGEYPVLVVVEGEGKGRHYPLSFLPEKIREPGKIKVGRRPEANDILLSKQDLHASREHAWIEYDEEQGCYRLHDTSTAGTQVNSDVIKRGATVLHHGDRIRCSETVFQLALPTLTGQERTLDV